MVASNIVVGWQDRVALSPYHTHARSRQGQQNLHNFSLHNRIIIINNTPPQTVYVWYFVSVSTFLLCSGVRAEYLHAAYVLLQVCGKNPSAPVRHIVRVEKKSKKKSKTLEFNVRHVDRCCVKFRLDLVIRVSGSCRSYTSYKYMKL